MGQVLRIMHQLKCAEDMAPSPTRRGNTDKKFPDLSALPPELSLSILSYLNATDLCLASCVWESLGHDDVLWQGLCRSCWGSVSIYRHPHRIQNFSFRSLYMMLDEVSLTCNTNPWQGISRLLELGILENNPEEIAKFIFHTKKIWPSQKRLYLETRRDVLAYFVQLHNFQEMFLPNALRRLFADISAPNDRGSYLVELLERFSERFIACNPKVGLAKDDVFVLCFSLIMLSVDLCSPHVKNKMSKREFIKNTCRAVRQVDVDLAGHLYDNIYLIGHVAPEMAQR